MLPRLIIDDAWCHWCCCFARFTMMSLITVMLRFSIFTLMLIFDADAAFDDWYAALLPFWRVFFCHAIFFDAACYDAISPFTLLMLIIYATPPWWWCWCWLLMPRRYDAMPLLCLMLPLIFCATPCHVIFAFICRYTYHATMLDYFSFIIYFRLFSSFDAAATLIPFSSDIFFIIDAMMSLFRFLRLFFFHYWLYFDTPFSLFWFSFFDYFYYWYFHFAYSLFFHTPAAFRFTLMISFAINYYADASDIFIISPTISIIYAFFAYAAFISIINAMFSFRWWYILPIDIRFFAEAWCHYFRWLMLLIFFPLRCAISLMPMPFSPLMPLSLDAAWCCWCHYFRLFFIIFFFRADADISFLFFRRHIDFSLYAAFSRYAIDYWCFAP